MYHDAWIHECEVQEILLFSRVFRLALWSTQPPIQYVTKVLFPGAKQLKDEADHSPTSSAKVKN
jgi:hypothetical protein